MTLLPLPQHGAVRRRILAAGFFLLAATLGIAPEGSAEPAAPVFWRPVERHSGFLHWRGKIALLPGRPGGPVYIGGTLPQAQAEGALLFRRDGRFLPFSPFPHRTERSFVLDLDSRGGLWLTPFQPGEEETYDGLRILHLTGEGERFDEEVIRPGLWPQAIDLLSPGEGYIAGNHGRLLALKEGRWQDESLEGPPGRWRDHNFLALRLLPGGDGWAVGKPGLLARRTGGRFRPVAVPPELASTELTSLDVDPSGNLFVTTHSGEIARFDGHAWRVDKVADGALLGIDLVGERDGWAVGARGTVLRFDGENWRQQASPTGAFLYDVAMATPTEGYIAGRDTIFEASPAAPLFLEADDPALFPMLGLPAFLAAAGDLDRDGDLDLLLGGTGGVRLFETMESGRGSGRDAAGRQPFPPPSPEAELLDFAIGEANGDGRPDLVATYLPAAMALFVQQPDGSFTDQSASAGLAGLDTGNEGSVSFVDFDLDGDLDLYLARAFDSRGARQADLALRNDGSGRFAPLPSPSGGDGVERIALWGDLDGDHRPDLVLPANGGADSRLWRSAELGGRPALVDATPSSGLEALPPALYYQGHLADLDLDGVLDLILFGDSGFFLRGRGNGRFDRPETPFAAALLESRQPSRASAIADLDRDGRAEVLVARRSGGRAALRVERLGEDGRRHDVAAEWGLADLEGDALLPFDFDRDGDLDLLLASLAGTRLLVNQLGDGPLPPPLLAVDLRGRPGNPAAIGAELRLFEESGKPEKLLHFEVSGLGDSPFGRRPPGAFLLAVPAGGGSRLEVIFPGGTRRVLPGLLPGQRVLVDEVPASRWAGGWDALAAWVSGQIGPLAGALLALLGLAGWFFQRRRRQRPPPSPAEKTAAIGPYTGLGFLGAGGIGEVFRALDPAGRPVAVKILHPHLARDPETRRRFEREAELLARLDFPQLLRGLGGGEHQGRPYLVAELLEGDTLRALLEREGGRPEEALQIADTVAAALEYLHGQGLVHRDVKTDNVFVLAETRGSWPARLKLLDLGLVRGSALATLTEQGQAVGTLAYMAPEQLRGGKAGAGADLWGLGLLLAEVCHGARPTLSPAGELGGFLTTPGEAPSEQRLAELFPPAWQELLRGLLAAAPEARFAGLGEVRRKIAQLLAG